ncbi:hypothetical protein CAPTEDRAFT_185439 [Capitella teleta]|uniref:Uncharacterized protein n=1 Tax=Capitella teleta TaxID=283909 RepID=R7UW07_CAPTE|nr:hypothetical protein CAPTEDRAFT_185439 [Capitella teleta]|eukprot:ELU08112.1 hypothetical protein CAPTEDRAFT_185439 [Capitella teleta]
MTLITQETKEAPCLSELSCGMKVVAKSSILDPHMCHDWLKDYGITPVRSTKVKNRPIGVNLLAQHIRFNIRVNIEELRQLTMFSFERTAGAEHCALHCNLLSGVARKKAASDANTSSYAFALHDYGDFAWIREHLIPEMEGERRLKHCIGERDSIQAIGGHLEVIIIENIQKAGKHCYCLHPSS